MIAEATAALKEAETSGDKRKAKERKEDLMRLKRVEQIYVRRSHLTLSLQSSCHSSECCTPRTIGLGSGLAETSAGDCFSKHKYAAPSVFHVIGVSAGCGIT
jgi:hypothetical protein